MLISKYTNCNGIKRDVIIIVRSRETESTVINNKKK